MGTRHPRIGVTRDPELAAALEITHDLLSPSENRSEAGQVRTLALLGASALADANVHTRAALDRRRVLARPGARPASHDLATLRWLDDEPVDEERRASRELEWARGGR